MRPTTFGVVALALLSAPAAADEIVLRADPLPIVDVTINGRAARLLVDPALPDVILFDPGAEARLGIRRAPLVAARVVLDDASIRARVARPSVRFANGKTSRAFAGLFGARWMDAPGIDGALGPGVLPYDQIRIVLRDAPGGEVHRFALRDPDVWQIETTLGGEPVTVTLDMRREQSLLNRSAASVLSENGVFKPTGAVTQTPFFLGLSTTTQPGVVSERVLGRPMGDSLARTAEPLVGATGDVDVLVVRRPGSEPPRHTASLGRAALANCHEIAFNRDARSLSLRCVD
jgi:hypothetical protein